MIQGLQSDNEINRHGRAKIFTQQEIQLILSDGLDNDRDACDGH
ncbi:hypothetical protein [Nostoc sp.]